MRLAAVLVILPLLLSGASEPDAARFENVADRTVLFAHQVQADGFWEFCLVGSKPKADLFSFHVVLNRGDAGVFRVDGVRVVRAEDEKISVCARQDPKVPGEQRLRKGERVELVAIGRTRGPVHLRLTVREVRTQ